MNDMIRNTEINHFHIMQNSTVYSSNNHIIDSLDQVDSQVGNALDFGALSRKLQEERVSVALNFFLR